MKSKQFDCSKRLPFLNKPENVARYEDGTVYLLDRRNYPFEIVFAECKTYQDVAIAIKNMVTQSYGPKYATAYAMVQAARELKRAKRQEIVNGLRVAADVMIDARPTNDAVKIAADRMYEAGQQAALSGVDVEAAVLDAADAFVEEDNERMDRLGKFAADLIDDGDTILNHCWADTTIAYTMVNVVEQGKRIKAICGETRPYLQGARLTANAISEIGVPTTVITDNMPAHVMSLGMINKFFAGCDRLTLSGHVFNKVGTLQIAICAHHFKVPFYAFSFGPDPKAAGPEDVINEVRDGNEVLYCLGKRTATPGVAGFYPAFDATPPEFVSGIITDTGVYPPTLMRHYWDMK